PRAPKKLSDILRLKHFRLENGQLTYIDRRAAEPLPLVWSDIDIDIDLSRMSPSQYTYELNAQEGKAGVMKALGTIDVDSLLLQVKESMLKLRTIPGAGANPLPAPMQRFIAQYEVQGALTVNAQATLPLRKIDSGEYKARIELE